MKSIKEQQPLHFIFTHLAKKYMGVLTRSLEGKGPDKYFYTLLVVNQSNETVTQQELADYYKIDKASMVRVIDTLSKQGFLRRKTNPDDRRQHLLQLTAKGKAIIPVVESAVNDLNDTALAGFTEKERKAFYVMLEKVWDNLSELPGDNFFMNFKKIK